MSVAITQLFFFKLNLYNVNMNNLINYEIVMVLVLSANCPECTHCSWNTEKEDKALPWAT